MDIGSIVKCIRATDWDYRIDEYIDIFGRVKTPIPNNYYTIRGFYKNSDGHISIYLEEIINDLRDNLPEPSFDIECFVEELPPMDILALIEQEETIEAQ